jgi:hypothetical protein
MAEPLLTPATACTPTSANITSCRASIRRAGGGITDAARPQRRGQDDDAAHHHGPLEALGKGTVTFDGPSIGGMPTPDIARRGIAYVPESMASSPT